MADIDEARRAEIIAELERRGVATPEAAPAPVAPAAAGASVPAPGEDGNTLDYMPAQPGSVLEKVGADVAQGLPEIPGALVRGVAGAIAETGNFFANAAAGSDAAVANRKAAGVPNLSAAVVVEPIAHGVEWLGNQVKGLISKPESVTGNLAEGVSQFVTGWVGAGKFIKLPAFLGTAGKPIGESLLRNGAVAGVVFGGHEERLSNLVEQYPALQSPITEYLAAKPGDSMAEGRFKNALEGMIVGPMADALVWSVKGLAAGIGGRAKDAAKAADEIEKLFAKVEAESPEAVALRALDPDNGVTPKGEPVVAKVADEVPEAAPVTKAADEGIPKVEKIEGPAVEHPAPYAEDLRTGPAVEEGVPRTLKLSDVMPKLPKGSGEDTVEAITRRFTMNPEDGGLHPISPTQRFNLSNIDSPDSLKAALDAVTTMGEKTIATARISEVRSFERVMKESAEFADMVGVPQSDYLSVMGLEAGGKMKPTEFLTLMGHDAAVVRRLDARQRTYRMFMVDAVSTAGDLADKALTMKGTVEGAKLSAQAVHSANLAVQVAAMVKGIETGVARTLGAQRMAAGSAKRIANWDLELLAKQIESGGAHMDNDKLLLALKNLKDNPKGFNKFMEKSFGEKGKDAYTTWFMNALLSSPKTWVANAISNTVMAGYMPIERAVAGAITSGVGPGKAVTRMFDEYHGMMMGLQDSMRVAGTAFKNNVPSLDPRAGTPVSNGGMATEGLSSRALGLTKDIYSPTGEFIRTDHTPALSAMMDGINVTVNIPSRVLTGTDEMTKQVVYRGYLYSRAAEAARIRGLKGTDFAEFVAAKMDDGFADGGNLKMAGAAEDKAALQVSREATFTQDLEYGISKWVQGMSNDSLIARHVVPFVRTPVNLFRFSWKHTPIINALEEGVRRDWMAGGETRAKVIAQTLTGAAMWTLAVSYALSGNVTGGAPLNPGLRQAQEATGHKEYSIKTPDGKYLQFNRFDPFATILGMAADYVQISSHASQNELDKLAYGMTLAMFKNLSSKTYLQGLTNVFNAYGDVMAGRSSYGIDAFAYRTLGSVVVPAVVAGFRGYDDSAMHEVRSALDAIKSRVPGYSKDLPPTRNFVGEIVTAPTGFGPDFMSPIGMTVHKHDKVYDELARAMTVANHPLARAMPQLGETTIDLREVKLARNGQQAYDRMQELLFNSGVKEKLGKLFESPAYQNAKDGSLDYAASVGSKLWRVNVVLHTYKERAQNQLLAENPELYEMFNAERNRMRLTGTRGDTPAIYQPPQLLESLTGKRK